jgi:hypothetical protein
VTTTTRMASIALGITLALAARTTQAKPYPGGTWVLKTHRDRFTGMTRCGVRSINHRVVYQPAAVGFFIGRRQNTLNAWYKVDGNAAVRWQDRIATLIALDVSIDGPGLDNPTGGWVWIPLGEVLAATTVAIRADDRGHIFQFSLAPLGPVLASAQRAGCASDAAFRI